jgi:hypothetical protein
MIFVFIFLFFFLVLAFRDSSSLRTHFWPFTPFLRKLLPGVAKNFGNRFFLMADPPTPRLRRNRLRGYYAFRERSPNGMARRATGNFQQKITKETKTLFCPS